MGNRDTYTKDFVSKVRKYYIDNNISLEDISKNSTTLFGKNIPLADIKWLSRDDVDGAWSVQKANKGRRTEDTPVGDKIRTVADKLYNIIVDDDSDLSANQLAQLAKTWSDLVDKAKLGQNEITAKTPIQSVKDIFEKEIASKNNNE